MAANANQDHRPGIIRRLVGFAFRAILYTVVPLVAAVIGGYYYATGGRVISTDNAYVKAD